MVVKGKTITKFPLNGRKRLNSQFYLKILLEEGKVYEKDFALLLKAK
jgi:hypothetical protein